ncbi:MAG: radical SAM protein [Methanothermobacter sp.]|nr:radical SAM protein [Methanothermobacter sp.]
MKVLFIEPPKDPWFLMGEYRPPPLGILGLAAYIEAKNENIHIEVLDCQAERVDWKKMEKRIDSLQPDMVVPSALATCNTYLVLRTVETAKKVNPDIITVVGGQHFTATAQETLKSYPEIDFIIRGEGEETLNELIQNIEKNMPISKVRGLSFKYNDKIIHNPPRPLIQNLDELPFPGYHFVADHMKKYHFKMMAGNARYALIEASRGCDHQCTFCSQWKHWQRWRAKSPQRIADEIEHLYNEYGITFLWFTDDNLGSGARIERLCDELIKRGLDDLMWFVQARSDDIIKNKRILPKMRKAGNYWIMAGLERHDNPTLKGFNKNIRTSDAKVSMDLLKENDIFAQATFIIGERRDSHKSIEKLREFANMVDPDLAIFMILTPFPGTKLYDIAKANKWIEDKNWANYDMIHAVMPTENLSREEVQEELYECYRSFYGNIKRRLKGLFSLNILKGKVYRYMAGRGVLQALGDLF